MRSAAVLCLLGAVSAAVTPRNPQLPTPEDGQMEEFRPLTKNPMFFNLKVDDYCNYPPEFGFPQTGPCPLTNYAIRLEGGRVIATPFREGYDAPLPTFFVDDDTQMYTVSREPLQMYVDEVDGSLHYARLGWVPPNAISIGFHRTGTNPMGVLHPSSAFLTWPSTYGTSVSPNWTICAIGGTRQYQVFADFQNFYFPQGVVVDQRYCYPNPLAAVNANPWGMSGGDDSDSDDDK